MTGPIRRPPFDWEAAGRDLARTMTPFNAVVVVGTDPVATGRAAVGLARSIAMHRKVALGDLFAESPPIQELVHTDDPHGLVDCFLYGVSMTKIAHEVPDAGQLHVMLSGTEPPPYEEILVHPRWQRLAAGFREVGALLILVAPATAPRLSDLIAVMDGAVLVGDLRPGVLPDVRVLGSVREPRAPTPRRAQTPASVIVPHENKPELVEVPRQRPSGAVAAAAPAVSSRRRIAAISGIVLTVVAAGVTAWLAYRPLAKVGRHTLPPPDSLHIAGTGIPKLDSAGRDSAGADTAGAAQGDVLRVTNPADSAQASAFAVELVITNTQAGAIFKLQKDGKNLPAATFAPALIQGARWFKVVSGAYSDRAGADSLLVNLRKQNLLQSGESVVRLPYAFLIESGVPATAVPGMVAQFADRGQPVYALRQTDGTAWLLVGAFASVEQAALYTESLRASSIEPKLVFRKGRMF